MSDRDDDAFTFPGDDEPAFRPGEARPPAAAEQAGSGAAEKTAPVASELQESPLTGPDPDAPPASVPAAVLILYGFVAGWMVLYTIGWTIVAVRSWTVGTDQPLLDILTNTMLTLMAASPLIWMVTSIVVTRGKRLVWTALWLLVGVLLLLPWPYLIAIQVAS